MSDESRVGLTLKIKGDDHIATMGVVLGPKPYVLIQLEGDEDGFDFIVEAGGASFDGLPDVANFLSATLDIMREGTVAS